jgi:AcrR family transcriptional regulator
LIQIKMSKKISRKEALPAGVPPAEAVPRGRGRPSRAQGEPGTVAPLLTREHILDRATQLAMVEPLGELSMVGLAREFGVTPALIHYYVGGRDDVISGVVNRYFKARVLRMAALSGDWKVDLDLHARTTFALMIEYGGVLRYVMSHNRFRLFQQVAPGETDYGLVFFDRYAEIFRLGGFTAEQASMGYHLLSQYVMTAAYAQVGRQLPGQHEKYILSRIKSRPAEQFPGAHFISLPFSRLDSASAFDAGLAILLDGFEGWLRRKPKAARHKG